MHIRLFLALALATCPASLKVNANAKSIPALAPRQDDGLSCGIVTDADLQFSYILLLRNANCHDLHADGKPIKSYTIAKGCAYLFFAHPHCAENCCQKKPVEDWTGWVFGPYKGDFTKLNTTHYQCGDAESPFKRPRGKVKGFSD